VAGILPKRARLILSAPAKLGKTRFALGLCLAVAAGKSAMGFQITEPAKGIYLYGEGGERMMQDRLRKMLAGFDVDETALRERLLFPSTPRLENSPTRPRRGNPQSRRVAQAECVGD